MTYIKPTSNNSPFATSTVFTQTGASSYNQSWVTVSGNTATISGIGLSTTAGQLLSSGLNRYYYANHNSFPLSGQLYYTAGQCLINSSDEAICVDSSFTLVNTGSGMDTAVSRTNIIRLDF